LLNAHPNMKFIVVKTIQELLLTKSSTKERAQYYTMITLNQIILSSKDVNTANLLLEVYFIFFKKLLKITQDNDAADAAEAEAAGPDSDNDDDEKKKAGATAPPKKEKKGREQKVYIGQKALRKAKEELAKKHAEEEKSMDNKLLAAILTGVNRALPFAKMDDAVMDQHVGVIFQIAHAGNFNTVVQSLVLLNHIARLRPTIADRFYRTLYDSLLDPRLDGTSKKAMYLNVLFKAMKADSDTKRVMAFIKRIMQACQQNQVEFASGALFLVSQVLALNPQLNTMLTQPEDHEDAEHTYDPLKRDPRFANAQTSCLWEAAMLAHHYHPSITHSIKQVFAGEQVAAISNLHNHSLAHFLDRFVFRRPKAEDSKKSSTMRGQSLMQPFVASSESAEFELGEHGARIMRGHLLSSKRVGGVIGGLDLTSKKIADLQKSDMPADEQFFLQFFQTKKERMGKRVKKSKQEGESGLADDSTGFANAMGEDADELDEDEVWKAMTSGMPRTGEGDEDGEDVDEDDDDLLAALQEDEDEGDDDDDMGESDSSDEGEDSADLDEDQSDDDGFPTFDDEMSEASDDGEVSDEPASKGTKRKGDDSESADKKKKKKKEKLPMFGSFEDYAHLIDNDEGLE
ncbi:RNA-binding ribosome biosynthesis protein mak21, partial [Linderina pennispora]